MAFFKKILKVLEHFKASWYQALRQKCFKTIEGDKIHYIFKYCQSSDCMIVVFSGFSSHYRRARYNYLKSLKKTPTNQLFILDDSGFCGGGSYYLGEQLILYKHNAIKQLIEYIQRIKQMKKIVMLGSSKGGTCSLLYGAKLGANVVISGSPQFYIGNYLKACEYHQKIFKSILDVNDENVCTLNDILLDELSISSNRPLVYLVFSSKEGDYENHIKPLINYLKEKDYKINLFDCEFSEHSEIGIAMKDFIQDQLPEILENI